MGIKQLSKLIKEKTKNAVVPRKFEHYYGAKIAIDAPMSIYQFLVAVRADGSALGTGGNTTSHLSGMFYRTVKLIEAGITPVYVFDGKAPALKVAECRKRADRREKATRQLEEAIKDGDKTLIEKWEKRQVKIEEFHVEDCKKLLQFMGVPFITAISEAE
ncbi:flap endonuclease-1, partial [Pancytospora epiphaga]